MGEVYSEFFGRAFINIPPGGFIDNVYRIVENSS
jgi:hypothetical protein